MPALACVAAALSACLGGCDDVGATAPPVASFEATVPAGFTPHRSRGGEVTLKAPPSWRETSTSGSVVLNLRTGQKASSVNVVVVKAAPGETLDKTMAGLSDQLRHEFADFKTIRNEFIFLKDVPAGRLVYEASRNGFHGKLMQVFITRGGRHYILTYTADPERYDVEARVVDQVIASMEIEK